MARNSDEFDVAALRQEMEAMRLERQQERAETAMLRAEVQGYRETARETQLQKEAFARFLAWVGLTAEEKTQLVADRDYNADPSAGPFWEIGFPEHPTVRLRATTEFDVVGRYNRLCGITSTHPEKKHTMRRLDAA